MVSENVELQRSVARDRKLSYLVTNFPGFKTRGQTLNDREGITGNVYLGDYQGVQVAVKMLDDWTPASDITSFNDELRFILDPKSQESISFEAADKGIPLPQTRVRASFVRPVSEIMSSPFRPSETLVTHLAPRIRLYDREQARTSLVYAGNDQLPFSVHFATWTAYVELLKQLKQRYGLTMDSQVDDITLGITRGTNGIDLGVVKIDCVPVPTDARVERDITRQIKDGMRDLYARGTFAREARPLLQRLGSAPDQLELIPDFLRDVESNIPWDHQSLHKLETLAINK